MKRIAALILFFTLLVNAQTKSELFPDNLTIQPFTANMLEPKLGFVFQTSKSELRLDIGSSMDIYRKQVDNLTYSFGADLFTYTLLRSEDDFHFPVDAVDYLFGVNVGIKYQSPDKNCFIDEIGARFRLSHISAHMVDGHLDPSPDKIWIDNQEPRVYSREFFELMPYVRINDLRLYLGFTYIYHVDPGHIGKENYQVGFDYFYKGISDYVTPFIAYDLKLINIDKYTANNSINAGIKFGKPNGKGFSVYYHYYSGKSVHGEYYEFNREYSALGFNLDL
ncbi:MAG: DUF1207 domain-containing protein [Rhodothermaceae bacterium]